MLRLAVERARDVDREQEEADGGREAAGLQTPVLTADHQPVVSSPPDDGWLKRVFQAQGVCRL